MVYVPQTDAVEKSPKMLNSLYKSPKIGMKIVELTFEYGFSTH